MLNKGTKVRVQTTNGGDVVATLLQNYRPTYDVCIDINGRWAVISPLRLKSVVAV